MPRCLRVEGPNDLDQMGNSFVFVTPKMPYPDTQNSKLCLLSMLCMLPKQEKVLLNITKAHVQ